MSWMAHLAPVFRFLMWMKYLCCVGTRYAGMKPKIIDNQSMQRMYECIFRFEHFGRSFISPAMYKRALTKRIAMSRSVFRASSHFCNASTDDVHMSRLTLWVNWHRCYIVSWATPQRGQRLVITCPRICRIFIVAKVLLNNFVMKCGMWTVVVSRARLNMVRSTPPPVCHVSYVSIGPLLEEPVFRDFVRNILGNIEVD